MYDDDDDDDLPVAQSSCICFLARDSPRSFSSRLEELMMLLLLSMLFTPLGVSIQPCYHASSTHPSRI